MSARCSDSSRPRGRSGSRAADSRGVHDLRRRELSALPALGAGHGGVVELSRSRRHQPDRSGRRWPSQREPAHPRAHPSGRGPGSAPVRGTRGTRKGAGAVPDLWTSLPRHRPPLPQEAPRRRAPRDRRSVGVVHVERQAVGRRSAEDRASDKLREEVVARVEKGEIVGGRRCSDRGEVADARGVRHLR